VPDSTRVPPPPDHGENVQLDHAQVRRSTHTFPVCIVAADIAVAENIGSLFRIADALGVERLFLTGCSPVPPHARIRKTARATEQSVAYEYHAQADHVVGLLRTQGYTIVSLEITSQSLDIRSFDAARFSKLALIVGAENQGVSQTLLDASDYTLHIPMFGRNSSMNLATACAIGVFELTRRFMP
jgi:tRNA G18 (ribose-2'-O)-methylase SpoU